MTLYDYEKEHLEKIRGMLPECMVLLKKDGAFPLSGPCRLAAYGNGVRHSVRGGTGSGDVNAHVTVNIEEGLLAAGFELITSSWLDRYDKHRAEAKKAFRKELKREAKAEKQSIFFKAMGAIMAETDYDIPLDFGADAAIYVLSRISGEGADRKVKPGDVLLTETEKRDILALNKNYDKFMLVLNTGGPVDLTPVKDVANILVLSQLGSEMGNALADVLLGKASPSGKLTTTWAAAEDYCEDIRLGNADNTFYNEGIYVGYRWFDTVGKKPLFPFGYGLSYADLSISDAKVSVSGSNVAVKATVKNGGDHPGKETLQVYVTKPEKELRNPWQELAGFAKTSELKPGDSEEITACFDAASIASFDETKQAYVLEAGEYVVRVGSDSENTVPAAVLTLSDDVCVRKVRSVAGDPGFEEKTYVRAAREEDLSKVPRLALDPATIACEEISYEEQSKDIAPVIKAMSDEELAYMIIGNFSKKGGLLSVIGEQSSNVAGAAGEITSRFADRGIKTMVMADGPAGLRLSKDYFTDAEGVHPIGGGSIPQSILDVLSAPLRKVVILLASGKRPKKDTEIKHQYCTALPIGTAIAQSWNVDLAEACGDIIGDEMGRFGVHLWLAPALNIHRSILCGRNFEYYSEDPLISGKIAAAVTRGVQAHSGKGVTIKHFVANNCEYNRYFNNSVVSERALREIYLKGFRICIEEAKPLALMTSYNLINGIHSSESRPLTEGFLRAECGYEGIVMTDWVLDLKNHGRMFEKADAGRVAAAGGDLFMPGCQDDYDSVMHALKSGSLTREQMEINAERVRAMSAKLNA